MIRYRDFLPQIEKRSVFGYISSSGSLEETVAEANEWIERQQVTVLNIETVIFLTPRPIHENSLRISLPERGSSSCNPCASGTANEGAARCELCPRAGCLSGPRHPMEMEKHFDQAENSLPGLKQIIRKPEIVYK